jgi:hypothetical protein
MLLLVLPAVAGAFQLGGPEAVDAYLDPGTGSIVIQVVIGVAVGGLAAVGIFWTRVKGFLRNLFSKGDQT